MPSQVSITENMRGNITISLKFGLFWPLELFLWMVLELNPNSVKLQRLGLLFIYYN